MSLRLDSTEPDAMQPADRAAEIAEIFARGILRLHGRVLPTEPDIEIALESDATRLELAAHRDPDGVLG